VTAVMPASIEADLVVGCGFQFILLVVSGSGLVVRGYQMVDSPSWRASQCQSA